MVNRQCGILFSFSQKLHNHIKTSRLACQLLSKSIIIESVDSISRDGPDCPYM